MGSQEKIYFISDLHIGDYHPEIELKKKAYLLSFLDQTKKEKSELFINGDLFDFWFDYHSVIPRKCFWVCAALSNLIDAGCKITILPGNHDYWMFSFFQEMGIQVYHEPQVFERQGKKIFLAHGDALAPKDTGYRFIKTVFRHPISIALYRWLHPDLGAWIAENFSRSSRRYTTKRERTNPDLGPEAYREVAHSYLKQQKDYVIFGHTHQPERIEFPEGVYINLGNWITDFTYAEMDQGKIELKTWHP